MYRTIGPIRVHQALQKAIEEILPGTGVQPQVFWDGLGSLLQEFSPENEALLRKRDAIQASIDAYLLQHKGKPWDAGKYTAFLADIGYLVPPSGPAFKVSALRIKVEQSIVVQSISNIRRRIYKIRVIVIRSIMLDTANVYGPVSPCMNQIKSPASYHGIYG